MTLKEKFEEVEIMFENQIGSLAYDELGNAADECEIIADDFASGFSDFTIGMTYKQVDGYFYFYYYSEWKTTKELLQIYKKEKGL